jgi:hypothetical protein
MLEKQVFFLDIIGRSGDISENRFQPALVRHDGFLLFTVGNPNNVLSSRFIQSQVWAGGFRPALAFLLLTPDT